MTEIFSFPDTDTRDWQTTKAIVLRKLQKQGFGNEEIFQSVLELYRPFWDQAKKMLNFRVEIKFEEGLNLSAAQNDAIKKRTQAGLDEYEKNLKVAVDDLMVKIFHRCVQLAVQKFT